MVEGLLELELWLLFILTYFTMVLTYLLPTTHPPPHNTNHTTHPRRSLPSLNSDLLSEDPDVASQQRRQGYTLYDEKPNFRRPGATGTWSDEEYGLPGFQWMYLRMKSFQRFTETWAMLERMAVAGLFDAGQICSPVRAEGSDKPAGLRVVSLGGGPGYEILAYQWFCEYEPKPNY